MGQKPNLSTLKSPTENQHKQSRFTSDSWFVSFRLSQFLLGHLDSLLQSLNACRHGRVKEVASSNIIIIIIIIISIIIIIIIIITLATKIYNYELICLHFQTTIPMNTCGALLQAQTLHESVVVRHLSRRDSQITPVVARPHFCVKISLSSLQPAFVMSLEAPDSTTHHQVLPGVSEISKKRGDPS